MILSWGYCLKIDLNALVFFLQRMPVTNKVPAGPYKVPILVCTEKSEKQYPSEELKDPNIKSV